MAGCRNFINHFRNAECNVRNELAAVGTVMPGGWNGVIKGWSQVSSGGYAECCTRCSSVPGCAGWTYNRNSEPVFPPPTVRIASFNTLTRVHVLFRLHVVFKRLRLGVVSKRRAERDAGDVRVWRPGYGPGLDPAPGPLSEQRVPHAWGRVGLVFPSIYCL